MVTVAWSLSYELFFYLAMPIVIGIVGVRARSTTWRVTFILLAAGSYGYLCVTYGGLPRLLMFAAGMLLYEALRIGVRGPGTFAALVAVAGAFSAMLVEFRPIGATGQVIGLFVAFPLLCLASFQAGMLANVFSWAPLRWLGNMSYSYYLIHGLSLKAAFMLLTGPLKGASFWLLMPMMFVWTLIPSAALFLMIERPFSLGAARAHSRVVPIADAFAAEN